MSLSNNSINQPNFRGVEQSLNIMRQVKSYFSVGMENVLEVATDMADYSKAEDKHVKQVQEIMMNYIRMERDIDNFMKAVDDVMEHADGDGEVGSLERMLTENLQKLEEKNDDRHLKKHEKYLELEQKIWDSRHPGQVPCNLVVGGPLTEDDIELTHQNLNTKCPYTGKQMVNPVRNIICNHAYDKTGIMEYVKRRGKKAMCPVGGCGNKKPITSPDLEDYKEMRKYIENLKKQTSSTPRPEVRKSPVKNT